MQLRLYALSLALVLPLLFLASLVALHPRLCFSVLLCIAFPALILAELLFSLRYTAAYRRLNAISTPPPDVAHCHEVFARFLKHDSMQHYIDFPSMLSKWHWDVPFERLHASHVAEFLSYGLFYRKQEDWDAMGQPHIPEQLVLQLEAAWGMSFSRENDACTGLPPPPLPFMAHLWEPVRCHRRPLVFYLGTACLCIITRLVMRTLGFRASTHPGGYVYYTRGLPQRKRADQQSTGRAGSLLASSSSCSGPDLSSMDRQSSPVINITATAGLLSHAGARSLSNSDTSTSSSCASGLDGVSGGSCSSSGGGSAGGSIAGRASSDSLGCSTGEESLEPDCTSDAPLLFLHGVGLGLLPYITLIMRLVATGRPVLAVESPHLSMHLVEDVPEVDTVVEALVEILDGLQLPSVGVVAHSYGTFMASRLVQRSPSYVRSMTLLDPCTFNMFTGQLIHSFVYHNPARGANMTTWFVAREMAHAASVCRRFYWTKLNLWADQLPSHTLVVLSQRDELVAVRETCAMLSRESPGTVQLVHPTHRHGDFIHDTPWQDAVVAALHTMDVAAVAAQSALRSKAAAASAMVGTAAACGNGGTPAIAQAPASAAGPAAAAAAAAAVVAAAVAAVEEVQGFDLSACAASPASARRVRGGGGDSETGVHHRNDSAEGTEGMGSARHMVLRSRKVVS
ncbi:MAG: hypothetical protein WDW38_005931 [Sanguina aurantia]